MSTAKAGISAKLRRVDAALKPFPTTKHTKGHEEEGFVPFVAFVVI